MKLPESAADNTYVIQKPDARVHIDLLRLDTGLVVEGEGAGDLRLGRLALDGGCSLGHGVRAGSESCGW